MAKRSRSTSGHKDQAPIVDAPAQDDDLSLNLDWAKGLFTKDMDKVVTAALLLAVVLLVFWIRMLPAGLPVADDWATQSVDGGLRQQITQQVRSQFPALSQESLDQEVEKQLATFKEQQTGQYDTFRQQVAQQFRERMSYTAENGKEYVYLGDLDSYFWLRFTRNWLETGMTCTSVVDGECLDSYPLAPVGVVSSFNPSLHVFAIGWFYKAMILVDPHYPLPRASYMVTVLIGVLGVIPAFFIGRRLAGNVAGVFAAVITALHPLLLSRSIGSDNDAWNITLPLFIMWFTIEALESKSMTRRVVYSSLIGLTVAAHAATWAGWWFIYLIILLGLVGALAFRAVMHVRTTKTYTIWKDLEIRAEAITLGVFYVSTFIFLALFTQEASWYGRVPLLLLSEGGSSGLDSAVVQGTAPELMYWPNVLTTVAELNNASINDAIFHMGGKLIFLGALIGILLMLLPRGRWRWEHIAALLLGTAISIYLVSSPPANRLVVISLLAIAVLPLLLVRIWKGEQGQLADALIVLVWFLAAVFASYNGIRFIMLLIPAFGIAFAVFAGRLHEWTVGIVQKEFSWNKAVAHIVVFALIAIMLIQPVRGGYGTARGYAPTIDDGWWTTLENIRAGTSEDAIINSWWDFGHWFKYVADRRVTADGTTQGTHVPHWLGLALVTPDEREAVGVLRMLDCGSDAYPGPFGAQGAYGKTVKRVQNPIVAHRIVQDIASLDKEDARAYLLEQGLTTGDAEDILMSSHCDPPEDIFITSEDMVGKAGVWAHFGLWDFEKAYIIQESRKLPKDAAVKDLIQRFGYTEEEATRLYLEAKSKTDEGNINAWISPWPGYISGWVGCTEVPNQSIIVCPLNIGLGQQGNVINALDTFVYNSTDPNASILVYATYTNGQKQITGAGAPLVLVDAAEELTIIQYPEGQAGLGVVMDVQQKRVMLADPNLAQSVFTQLFFLEGRYSEYFEKFDDQTTIGGSRILTWKVDWDGR